MTAHRVLEDLAKAPWQTRPATATVLTGSENREDALVIAASASETNTVNRPQNAGMWKLITVFSCGSGGTRAITFSDPYDSQGNTVITFSAARQSAFFRSVGDGSSSSFPFRWQLVASDGIGIVASPLYMSKVLTTEYDIATSTTLADPGLAVTVLAGKTYIFQANLLCAAGATGGYKFAMGGSATATTVGWDILGIGASGVDLEAAATALATTASYNTDTTLQASITGSIVVNAGGTFGPQFAQKTSNGTNSSVLVMSSFQIWQQA